MLKKNKQQVDSKEDVESTLKQNIMKLRVFNRDEDSDSSFDA